MRKLISIDLIYSDLVLDLSEYHSCMCTSVKSLLVNFSKVLVIQIIFIWKFISKIFSIQSYFGRNISFIWNFEFYVILLYSNPSISIWWKNQSPSSVTAICDNSEGCHFLNWSFNFFLLKSSFFFSFPFISIAFKLWKQVAELKVE